MKNFIDSVIDFGRKMELIKEESYNLWTHLPSCKETIKHHGDYYSEHCPEPQDVMTEAIYYLITLSGGKLNEEELKWFKCSCGEIEHRKEIE